MSRRYLKHQQLQPQSPSAVSDTLHRDIIQICMHPFVVVLGGFTMLGPALLQRKDEAFFSRKCRPPNHSFQFLLSFKMGCGGSKITVAQVEQPAASATLLDLAIGKQADAFDLTNATEIKAALSKCTVDELSASMRAWSPEVRSKIELALEVVAKQQAEEATAKAAPVVEAVDDQTKENAQADAAAVEALTASTNPENVQETHDVEVLEKPAAANSKSLCCF